MGKIYWIKVDGTEEVIEAEVSSADANAKFMEIMNKAENYFGRYAEMVWVLHKDRRTLMLVDEIGAIMGLPVNPRATEIYHQASRAQGRDWEGPPYIHGDVVLFEDIEID